MNRVRTLMEIEKNKKLPNRNQRAEDQSNK